MKITRGMLEPGNVFKYQFNGAWWERKIVEASETEVKFVFNPLRDESRVFTRSVDNFLTFLNRQHDGYITSPWWEMMYFSHIPINPIFKVT